MTTDSIITIAVFAGGWLGNAMYIKGVFGTKLDAHEMQITKLQDNVVYTPTCDAHREGLNCRVEALESVRNGK